MISQIANNPLAHRILSVFDYNKDKKVDFMEFISALSVFNSSGNKDLKLQRRYLTSN